jgi:hypothetical protein
LEVETIEHYFFECPSSQALWRSFEIWFRSSLGVHIVLSALTVLFGTNDMGNDGVLFLMDYCIIIGKWYIFRQKYCEKTISFVEFLVELKNNVKIEKYLLYLGGKEDTFETKWNML